MHSRHLFEDFSRKLLTHSRSSTPLHSSTASLRSVSHRSMHPRHFGQGLEPGLKTHFSMLELLSSFGLPCPAEEKAKMKAERAIKEKQICLMLVGIFLAGLSFNVKAILIRVLREGRFYTNPKSILIHFTGH